MQFSPTHRSFPWIHHQQWWHSHGRGEGGGHLILAPSYHHQRVTTVPRILQFLPPVHCQLQHHHQSPPRPAQRQGKAKSLSWNPIATKAFNTLKKAFTSALLLVHPNPELPFIVEVDASTTGVGAVLSQQQGTPPRLHPCAFFSRKLSPAEKNYDIANRELLAIKLALEEWRHWLEGAAQLSSFSPTTKTCNTSVMLNGSILVMARWALFFTRFQFKISYQPGPRNIKADALSQIHAPEESKEEPEGIIPAEIISSPIQWTSPPVASSNPPANPPGCPPDHQCVPRTQRTPLIHSTHTSLGTGHPGVNTNLSLLRDRFWWPNMARNVRRSVQGCPDCTISRSPRHLPAGKLHPLPIPNRPWSHLGVDFITDLPVSDGHTCILVIIDRFSKFCRLTPLTGLPTALQKAELLFNRVFRYYSIPEDIVSDRGPQFISRVWTCVPRASFVFHLETKVLESGGRVEKLIQFNSRLFV